MQFCFCVCIRRFCWPEFQRISLNICCFVLFIQVCGIVLTSNMLSICGGCFQLWMETFSLRNSVLYLCLLITYQLCFWQNPFINSIKYWSCHWPAPQSHTFVRLSLFEKMSWRYFENLLPTYVYLCRNFPRNIRHDVYNMYIWH